MSGTRLYPRLPMDSAMLLIGERTDITLSDLYALGEVSHASAAPAATGGHPADADLLRSLQKRIRSLAIDHRYPGLIRDAARFDRVCASEMFAHMDIVTADAADESVWSFLSIVLVPEIGYWRFPNPPDERLLGRPRNVLRRLWWRAWALGPDLLAVPDGCSPLGEDEFVQIMERTSLGGNRRTAQAIQDAIWRAEAQGLSVARSMLMRQLARRLRATRSHIALDCLKDHELADLLNELVQVSLEDVTK